MGRGTKISCSALAVLLAFGLAGAYLLAPGTLFLLRLLDGDSTTAADADRLTIEQHTIEGPGRPIRTKLFRPRSRSRRALLLVHGVHHGGYDEPRLTHLARRLTILGYTVAVPEIMDLKRYDLRPRAVDEIERAARWLLDDVPDGGAARDGRIGLLGISFAGGLGLSAAGRTSLRGRLAFVFSFGGHADIDRTLHYLVTGQLPGGGFQQPHVYGQAVILRQVAAKLVPAQQVDGLREALSVYLRGDGRRARELGRELAPPARRLLELCVERDSDALGGILEPIVAAQRSDPTLSPVRGDAPDCPVFLLHGRADNVIPPTETLALESWAAPATETHALVSAAIEHVELNEDGDAAGLLDYYALARFWTRMLRI